MKCKNSEVGSEPNRLIVPFPSINPAHEHDTGNELTTPTAGQAVTGTASTAECAQHFAGTASPLALCFPFVRPHAYRAACEHAVKTAKTPALAADAACQLSRAYVAACRAEHVPVTVRAACVQCAAAHQVGEPFEVVAPADKQADVVVVVDTASKHLGDLVQPLLVQLRQELRARDLQDVHIAVVGYQEDREYVRVFSSSANGQLNHGEKWKLTDGGHSDKRSGPLVTGSPHIDRNVEVRNSKMRQFNGRLS